MDAINHFLERYPNHFRIGINYALRINSVGLFTSAIYVSLSSKFQGIVKHVGEFVSGDEKLARFTGNSAAIRIVPHKPARVGLWFYQLVMQLQNKLTFLLQIRLHDSDGIVGENIPVSEIVKNWSSVVKRLGEKETLLTMDSYYMDNTSKEYLMLENIKYIASLNPQRFQDYMGEWQQDVVKPSHWSAMHNSKTQETILHYWSNNEDIGKKFVISNAFKKSYLREISYIIPLWDIYKITFSGCDIYNKQIFNRNWPHRHSRRHRSGDIGFQSSFAFSCILQNCFNCYFDINKIPTKDYDYRALCIELSDCLFNYANTLH